MIEGPSVNALRVLVRHARKHLGTTSSDDLTELATAIATSEAYLYAVRPVSARIVIPDVVLGDDGHA
jgi:hypothetical protein